MLDKFKCGNCREKLIAEEDRADLSQTLIHQESYTESTNSLIPSKLFNKFVTEAQKLPIFDRPL